MCCAYLLNILAELSCRRGKKNTACKKTGKKVKQKKSRKGQKRVFSLIFLDKKLKPVLKMLAESRNQGPEIRDIFGGIGYILGLVGLGAYIHYRKKRTDRIADDA